eukprot:2799283-Prymnesium_polylepis.1
MQRIEDAVANLVGKVGEMQVPQQQCSALAQAPAADGRSPNRTIQRRNSLTNCLSSVSSVGSSVGRSAVSAGWQGVGN